MRTILGQIFASTHLDSHGDQLLPEELRSIFESTPDPWLMCVQHDPAKPAIAKSYNKQFVEMEDGEWAIVSDIDVYDEEEFGKYGGVSIAFHTSTFTMNPDRAPEVTVTMNPRVLPIGDYEAIARSAPENVQINVRDLHQKGLDSPAILFLAFAAGGVFSGFCNAIGEEIFKVLKQKIKDDSARLKAENDADLRCNMTFEIMRGLQAVEVVASIRAADLDVLADRVVDSDKVMECIDRGIGGEAAKKVVIQIVDDDPCLQLEHYVDGDDTVRTP